MRLLIIAPEAYPVPNARGTSVETCIYKIASHLAQWHTVTVVSRRVPYLPRVSVQGKLSILRVPGGSRPTYIRNALHAVVGQSFDQIQVDNRPGFLPAVRQAFPSTPLSIFLHSLNFITPPMTSLRKANAEFNKADMIIANSESLASLVRDLYPAQRRKIKVVHLGVDTSQFHPPTPRQRLIARRRMKVDGSFVIGFVGRFVPVKGIPIVIKAAELVRKEVPSTKLLLAGSGTGRYVARIKALARKAKVPVRFLGRVPRRMMPKVYWAFDVFVCPTQGLEAFGLVVAEALASGNPTVASANGGIREIITPNTDGLLVQQFTKPRNFANAILTIAKNPGYARFLAMQGRISCTSRFSWSSSSATLNKLYFGGDGHE